MFSSKSSDASARNTYFRPSPRFFDTGNVNRELRNEQWFGIPLAIFALINEKLGVALYLSTHQQIAVLSKLVEVCPLR